MGTVASMRTKAKGGCPICGKPVTEAHKPFCSVRCGQIDLGRWLNGTYAIPGEPVAPGESSKAAGEDESKS